MAAQRDGIVRAADGCALSFTLRDNIQSGAPRYVLIHSLALDRSIWDGVIAQLGGEAAMLTYDCRGHGRSEKRPGPYTPELFARDLAGLMDHVGWDTATIVGCSMGGCTALAFAGLTPRARGLGLIDTTAWYGPEAPRQFRERAATAKAKGMSDLIAFQLSRWFTEPFREQNPELMAEVTRVFTATDVGCYAAACALLGDADLRSYLPKFKMPVSIVVGEEDYATPVAMAEQLRAAIPQARLTVIPAARHLSPIECPDAVAAELRTLAQVG
jgi:3-oxoadipate enol-lactonase